MKEENTPQEEETENIIDLGTNTVFEVTYKTIKCADGRTYTVAHREFVEPELPQRKTFKRGPGRPKKAKPPMEENSKIDMADLMEQAKEQVDK